MPQCQAGPAPDSGKAGDHTGRLRPCPNSPNCVSSLSQDEKHYAAPLYYGGEMNAAFSRLMEIINSFDRTRIADTGPDYIHAEFKSRIFGFVDDVEFLFDPDGRTIHLRSASRVGYSDLGVNRKRIEAIRTKWKEQ